jgi:hypothetical protein
MSVKDVPFNNRNSSNHKRHNGKAIGAGKFSRSKKTGWRGQGLYNEWKTKVKEKKLVDANEVLREIKTLTDTYGFNKAGLGSEKDVLQIAYTLLSTDTHQITHVMQEANITS